MTHLFTKYRLNLIINICTIGIFAYLNYLEPRSRREILEYLIKGLQRLEYRGYDSAGMSYCIYICQAYYGKYCFFFLFGHILLYA